MPKKYKNPPLLEAVCEFRFVRQSPWDLSMPGLMYKKFETRFPNKKQVKEVDYLIRVGGQAGPIQEIKTRERLQLLVEDEKEIIQVGEHLLSINRLSPYSSWEEFFPLIKEALAAYREIAAPDAFERVGLKYVNKIQIPQAPFQFEHFFDFYPSLGERLPQEHGPFFMGLDFSFDKDRDRLRLEITNGKTVKPENSIIFLTLDYNSTDREILNFAKIEDWLKCAHDRIEEVFEGCLKEPSRELFGQF
ncbi:MAG: TIGR04255 family protein [Acidobacteria bacterium]|nr:TIGR04255 family protein [Acidobacteriota bacterium]